jgi:hypothetical protein
MAKWFMGIAVLGCAVIWAIPGGAADPKVTKEEQENADVKAAMEFNATVLQEALGQEKVTRALKLKAATAARMVALAAQSGGRAKNAQLATIRDAALKLAEAIDKADDKDKIAAVRATAKDLLTLKPDENAQLAALEIMDKKFKLEDIMNQFSRERTGGREDRLLSGLGIESKLKAWEDELPKAGLGEVVQTGNQLCMVFEAVKDHQANVKFGPQEQWKKFCDQAYTASADLRDAARKGDAAATTKALKAMNTSCVKCHEVFKPKPGD